MSQAPVPRKAVSEPSYAVHRPSASQSSEANRNEEDVQLNGTQARYHDDPNQVDADARPNTPPPYSGPSTPTLSGRSQSHTSSQLPIYPGLPRLDYRLYSPYQHGFVLSSDQTTITSHAPILSKSAATLLPLVQSLCGVPPKPVVRITGKGIHGNIYFDFKINCMNLIRTDQEKLRMNYVKCIGPGELGWRGESKLTTTPTLIGLEQWVNRFCSDDAGIKQFMMERTIINWDTNYLEGRILHLISSTSFRGQVAITFPVTHQKVVVHSPDKYNRFFSNVTKVFTGSRKYEVIKSVWPYADIARGEGPRRCVVQDEEKWFDDWKSGIRYAVVGKKTGWVTVEDRLEELMEPRLEPSTKMEDWGF